jgi:hypothetical protein
MSLDKRSAGIEIKLCFLAAMAINEYDLATDLNSLKQRSSESLARR